MDDEPELYTAWLTTDRTCLDQPYADVIVLKDERIGDPGDGQWRTSVGDPVFHAVTGVSPDDADGAMGTAQHLLGQAGWTPDGPWEPVNTGYTMHVVRASASEASVLTLNDVDLVRLDSATRYPSIPTYHEIDGKGFLADEPQARFDGEVYVTEKIDGTNARLIRFPDGDYVIGSRTELIHARGDRVVNPKQRICEVLVPLAERISITRPRRDAIEVIYFEVYGAGVGQADGQYGPRGRNGVAGARAFDVMELRGAAAMLDRPRAEIAAWRDSGGQPFLDERKLDFRLRAYGVQRVPELCVVDPGELPRGREGMHAWLKSVLPVTMAFLADGGTDASEGVVLRGADRHTQALAKVRFEDYARDERKRAQKK